MDYLLGGRHTVIDVAMQIIWQLSFQRGSGLYGRGSSAGYLNVSAFSFPQKQPKETEQIYLGGCGGSLTHTENNSHQSHYPHLVY